MSRIIFSLSAALLVGALLTPATSRGDEPLSTNITTAATVIADPGTTADGTVDEYIVPIRRYSYAYPRYYQYGYRTYRPYDYYDYGYYPRSRYYYYGPRYYDRPYRYYGRPYYGGFNYYGPRVHVGVGF